MELKKSFCCRSPKTGISNSVIIFVLFGFVCGNHLQGQNGGGMGLIEQSLSFDPFASPSQASSAASSSASATAGGASSMAASSGGGSSSSSRSEAGRGQRTQLRLGNFDIHMPARAVSRLQDQLTSRNRQRSQARRKPVRLVVLRPDRRTGQTSTRIHDLLLRQQRQRPQQQRGTSLPVQLPGGVLNRQVQLPIGSRSANIPPRLQLQQLKRQQQLRKRQQQQQQQVVPLDEVLGVLRLLLGDIGPSPTTQPPLLSRFGDLFNAQHSVTAGPPGLTFLGGQPQLPAVSQIPTRTIINRLHLPRINTFPASSSASASSSAGLGGASSSASASSSSGFASHGSPPASPASTSFLAANSLTIEGQTPSGDLIIGGPGGTITIGAEVLNGISRTQNTSLVHTEFEEIEAEEGLMGKRMNPHEGLKVASKNGRQPPLVLSGKQSIVPKRPQTGSIQIVGQNNAPLVGQSNLPLLVENHQPLGVHGDQPLVIDGASVGLTLNNTGSGLKTIASGQSVSGTVSAASSSSSASSGLRPGGQNGGVSVTSEAQGKVIHLKGKDTIVVGGGSNGRIDVGNAVSGVKAPGNATFIVGG